MSDTNPGEATYECARRRYRDLINKYGEALNAKDPVAGALFAEATLAWEHLRQFNAGPESEVGVDLHLVAAFSLATQAGDAAEAERLYNAMGNEYRVATDTAESLTPGAVKIWMRR